MRTRAHLTLTLTLTLGVPPTAQVKYSPSEMTEIADQDNHAIICGTGEKDRGALESRACDEALSDWRGMKMKGAGPWVAYDTLPRHSPVFIGGSK